MCIAHFLMPLRWYGTSDKSDPTYKHFSRVVNLVLHGMTFAAFNSGLWFFQQLRHPWENLSFFTQIWLIALLAHLTFVIIRRPGNGDTETTA